MYNDLKRYRRTTIFVLTLLFVLNLNKILTLWISVFQQFKASLYCNSQRCCVVVQSTLILKVQILVKFIDLKKYKFLRLILIILFTIRLIFQPHINLSRAHSFCQTIITSNMSYPLNCQVPDQHGVFQIKKLVSFSQG